MFCVAFQKIQLTSDQFWAMTLPELRLFLEIESLQPIFTREHFDTLKQLYPDK